MRISCPHCGPRDVREFSYLGDATLQRPDPNAPDALARFTDYVYLRDNPAGPHRELWYHGAGCQAWLVVTRNSVSHDILGVQSLECASAASRDAAAP
jgi:heterotetrameric sarcosine oxidase delta subunit